MTFTARIEAIRYMLPESVKPSGDEFSWQKSSDNLSIKRLIKDNENAKQVGKVATAALKSIGYKVKSKIVVEDSRHYIVIG